MNAGFAYREIVGPDAAGRPILDHLAERYRHSTRDQWRSRLADGRVLVDGRAVQAGIVLRAGQCVAWIRPPWNEPDAPLAWAILHRDADVLAVAKPAGLPTIAGGGFLEHTLAALVGRRHPGAAPAHRLDRGASGVVLFAESARARQGLARAFREGRVVKQYRALVDGTPDADAFVIDRPIARVGHPRLGTAHAAAGAAPAAAGRAARTEVEVLERRGGTTLVTARPITGRPHQIRIHLAAAGFPLAGDPVYAAGGAPRPGAVAAGECGYHLHAERLEVEHPGGGGTLRIWCAPPPALRRTPA
jgi:23S rRNA pseudouridine1911/1915/1917 synthase